MDTTQSNTDHHGDSNAGVNGTSLIQNNGPAGGWASMKSDPTLDDSTTVNAPVATPSNPAHRNRTYFMTGGGGGGDQPCISGSGGG